MKTDDMTPEQREAVLKAFASISQSMAEVIGKVAEAIKPIMEAYNALPEDVKMRIAELQVKESIEDIAKPLTFPEIPDRALWVAQRIKNDYQKYWDPSTKRFVIIEPGKDQGDGTSTGDEIWKPTLEELTADLERSYDFEFK